VLSHEFLYGRRGEIRKARIKNLLALLGLVEERTGACVRPGTCSRRGVCRRYSLVGMLPRHNASSNQVFTVRNASVSCRRKLHFLRMRCEYLKRSAVPKRRSGPHDKAREQNARILRGPGPSNGPTNCSGSVKYRKNGMALARWNVLFIHRPRMMQSVH
jgi:hypothetical protein